MATVLIISLLGYLDDVRTLLLQGKSEFYYKCPAFAQVLK